MRIPLPFPSCRVARRWLRAVRVARYRSIPRHARVRPGVDPHGPQGLRKVRAGGERRVRSVGSDRNRHCLGKISQAAHRADDE